MANHNTNDARIRSIGIAERFALLPLSLAHRPKHAVTNLLGERGFTIPNRGRVPVTRPVNYAMSNRFPMYIVKDRHTNPPLSCR